MTDSAPPINIFTTKEGHAIALKPWTADVIAANVANFQTFVEAWAQLVSSDGRVQPEHLTAALPGLKASLSDPADLERVHGLAQLVDLIRAVWDYNEVGTGLGKCLRTWGEMQREMLGTAEGTTAT